MNRTNVLGTIARAGYSRRSARKAAAMRSLYFAVILGAVVLAGCGGGGGGGGGHTSSPPTISNLTYSPSAVPVSGVGTTVNGSINFTDSGGDLSTLTLTITDASGSQVSTSTNPIQGVSGQTSGMISGSFQVAPISVGLYTIHVTVTDTGGLRSNELTGPFEIVAVASQASLVANTGPSPMSLIAANGTLYWSESGTAALRSVPESGGAPVNLATRVVDIQAMGFVGSDVIWEDDRPGTAFGPCTTPATSRVISRTTSSGITSVLATGFICSPTTADVVVDGGTIFWITTLSTNVNVVTWVINATPVAGGPTTTIATSSQSIVALLGGSGTLYWMEGVFTYPNSAIRKVSTSGGVVTTVASGFDTAANTFVYDNNNVYYTTANFPRTSPPTETLVAQPLAGGAPLVLSSSISTPTRLAANGGNVLWIDAAAVRSIPAVGGSVTTLATTTSTPLDLLINGTAALWSESTGGGHGETGAIKSVPLVGGGVTVVHQGGDAPRRLALDTASQLNWTEGGPVGLAEGFSRIARVTPANAVQTVLAGIATATPAFVATASDLFIADLSRIKRLPLAAGSMPDTVAGDSEAIAALALDSSSVYWDSAVSGTVRRAPIGGGAVTTLATPAVSQAGQGGPIHLASNGNLYWVTGGSALLSVPSAGGAVNVVGQGLSNPADLVIDASNAYYTDTSAGNIMKLPLSGGTPAVLASVNYFPTASLPLVVDGSTSMLYWLDANWISRVPTGGGSVIRVLDFTSGPDTSATFAVDGAQVFFTEPATLDVRASAK